MNEPDATLVAELAAADLPPPAGRALTAADLLAHAARRRRQQLMLATAAVLLLGLPIVWWRSALAPEPEATAAELRALQRQCAALQQLCEQASAATRALELAELRRQGELRLRYQLAEARANALPQRVKSQLENR